MRNRVLPLVMALGSTIFLVAGCTATKSTPKTPVSRQQFVTDVKSQSRQAADIANIHVIEFSKRDGRGFGFASYTLRGKRRYASVIMTNAGYSMSTIEYFPSQTNQVRYDDMVSNGYEYTTGITTGTKQVVNAIIVFANGKVVVAPVVHGHFARAEPVQENTRVHVKHVHGVTNDGEIVS